MNSAVISSEQVLERNDIDKQILAALQNSSKSYVGTRYSLNVNCSNSLRYFYVDNLIWGTWTDLVSIFVEEYKKQVPTSNAFDATITPSPHIEKNEVKMLIEKLAAWERESSQKRIQLNEKFFKEKQKYLHCFGGSVAEKFLDKIFDSVLDVIVKVPYNASAIEITPDKSIFFDLKMNEHVLHFKIMIPDQNRPTAFFALYHKSCCIDNGVGEINEILLHLSDIINDGIPAYSAAQRSL